MRKFISIVVLGIYSLVMAHSFIPHHHHSEFEKITHVCNYEANEAHHNHQHEITGKCCVNSDQENDLHSHCNFDEITILAKSLSLSNLYLPSTEIEFVGLEKNNQSVSNCYIPLQIPDPHTRDLQLRGPPQFS